MGIVISHYKDPYMLVTHLNFNTSPLKKLQKPPKKRKPERIVVFLSHDFSGGYS